MTKLDQLQALEKMGADFAGLIFFPGSSRFVGQSLLKPEEVKSNLDRLKLVGVFVNEDIDVVLKMVELWGLDMVQLHGEESSAYCQRLRSNIPVVKAFRLGENKNINELFDPYVNAVDHFLFDTLGKQYGGTGEQFNWEMLSNNTISKSFFLSGGIGPNDLRKIENFTALQLNVFALDINSRFEYAPGIKDLNKVERFIKEVKSI